MGASVSRPIARRSIADDDPSLPLSRKVAIVGIGCRYANGVDSVQKFWEMLVEGMDCTVPPPEDRYDTSHFLYPGGPGDKAPGKMYNRRGGFLKGDVYAFDRQFFKIPPDEANYLDPQIRLLLEVVYEGFEDAGIPPSTVRGSNTGVYAGITACEYACKGSYPVGNISQYTNSGSNSCMASNRISYEFDLHGPSFSIDTACSSSLYAVHLACEAIRNGDCSMAVAGGVNLLLLPDTSIGFCQAGMLSPDGRCKSFDASANGYSRSEGAGVVILKPLQKAVEDGDHIYAVIRGGALTNDGRTPGIANPSYDAQVKLTAAAYRHAMVDPQDVQYVEAHGTGTQVGDTTEANALAESMGKMRPLEKRPMYIGSVKSNFGHTEGAAGIAGVIKVALCVRNKHIPKVVHFKEGNPKINFNNGIAVPECLIKWPSAPKMYAGCSSFGFGGANAHLVFEGYCNDTSYNDKKKIQTEMVNIRDELMQSHFTQIPTLLTISAATKETLEHRLSDWLIHLETKINSDSDFINAAYTSALKSQHHAYRVGIVARTKQEAIQEIRDRLENIASPNMAEGMAREESDSHVVFVFSGMGTQWWGMARQLMISIPSFYDTMKKIDKLLTKYGAKWSLLRLLTEVTDREVISQTEVAQPCICAVQIGLVELWRQCGINPHAIVGHSVGEVAAAYTAGLMTLEDAVRVIYNRGRQLMRTSGSGTMLAVLHPIDEVKSLLENSSYCNTLDVAAINSPDQIVLSGETGAIEAFSTVLKNDKVRNIILKVNNAFHSYQQEAVRATFLKKVKFLRDRAHNKHNQHVPTIPMMSTVTNEYITREDAMDPNYWYKNIRQQVKFMPAIEKVMQEGYTNFIEIGPHPALMPAVTGIFAAHKSRHSQRFITHSLKRPRDTNTLSDDLMNLFQSLAKLYVEGCHIDLQSLFTHTQCVKKSIPMYPWQRVKCTSEVQEGIEISKFPMKNHAMLGKKQKLSSLSNSSSHVWKSKISLVTLPWLKDHVVQGNVIVPAAAYVETALAAYRQLTFPGAEIRLQNLQFERFLFAPSSALSYTTFETQVDKDDGDVAKLYLRSHDPKSDTWTQHSSMEMNLFTAKEDEPMTTLSLNQLNVDNIQQRCPIVLYKEEFYKRAEDCGFLLGKSFHCNSKVCFNVSKSEGLFFADMSEEVSRESNRYTFHPAYLDSLFQAFAVLKSEIDQEKAKEENIPYNPVFGVPRVMKEMSLKGKVPEKIVSFIKMHDGEGDEFKFCDIIAADATTAQVFLQIKGFKFAKVSSSTDQLLLWSNIWKNVSSISTDTILKDDNENMSKRRYLILGDDTGFSLQLKNHLGQNGNSILVIESESLISDSWQTEVEGHCETFGPTDVVLTTSLCGIQDVGALMSYDTFEKTQTLGGIMCVQVYNVLCNLESEHPPSLWLISQGVQATQGEEETVPAMTGVQAVGVTIVHENPEYPVVMIDIPVHHDVTKSANIVAKLLQNPMVTENQISLRPSKDNNQSYDIYSPRVMVQAQNKFSGKIITPVWKIDSTNEKSWRVRRNELARVEVIRPGRVCVKVESFLPVFDNVDDEDSHTVQHFLFAGKVTHSDEIWDNLGTGKMVIGITKNTITSSLVIDTDSLCSVPDQVSPIVVISAIQHLLIPFVNMSRPDGEFRLLIYSQSVNDDKTTVITSMAKSLGVQVQVVVLGFNGDDELSTSDYSSGSERSSPTNEIEDEWDLIIFSDGEHIKRDRMQKLCAKLRPIGKVLFLSKKKLDDKTKAILPALAGVVVANFTQIIMSLESSTSFRGLANQMLQTLATSSEDTRNILQKMTESVLLSEVSTERSISKPGMVVLVDTENVSIPLEFDDGDFKLNKNASYIVTGGTKGFGCELVEWLVTHGAGYVIVFSRNLVLEEETEKKFTKLRNDGAVIEVMKTDVSNHDAVKETLESIKSSSAIPQLEGVFHCAVIYADTLLKDLSPDVWNDVQAVKGYGALLLHHLTVHMAFPIKHFVLVSSIIALLGNAGQANYCAANTYLASLGQLRRSQGLPATVIYGGVINSTGFAVRQGFVSLWEEKGVKSVTPAQVLTVLGSMLKSGSHALGVTSSFSKEKYFRKNKHLILAHMKSGNSHFSIFKNLVTGADKSLHSQDDTFANRIRSEEPGHALGLIEEDLMKSLMKILGRSDDIPKNVSPFSLGINSLMSSELSSLIEESFDVLLPPVDLLNDQVTVIGLGKTIYKKMMKKSSDEPLPDIATSEKQSPPLLLVQGPTQYVKAQLVCFPPNGGGKSVYQRWHPDLNQNDVQTMVLQLPGWEGREKEKPIPTLNEIVSVVGEELKLVLQQGKFVFYGHSMGGLIAFEVAHYLLEKYGMCPSHLFIGGWYAPSLPYPHPTDFNVPLTVLHTSTNLSKTLKEHGADFRFIEDSVLHNKAVMARLLPCIEIGLEVCKSYKNHHTTRLYCGLTVFVGRKDEFVKPDMVDKWKDEIIPQAKFKKITINGKHMFVVSSAPSLLKEIGHTIPMAVNGMNQDQLRKVKSKKHKNSDQSDGRFVHGNPSQFY
ncbi:phenolphthiocerol synthesis polyketide synthase type I Pks15/1-like [Glandiceps talaboti]